MSIFYREKKNKKKTQLSMSSIIYNFGIGGQLTLVDDPPRRKGMPKRMWMETFKKNLKTRNLFVDLAQNRSKWRNRIHVVNSNII